MTRLARLVDDEPEVGAVTLLLVLSDIDMPGMSGRELLAEAEAVRPDVPVIMITAYGDADTERRARARGAAARPTKPIDVAAPGGEIDSPVERAA